MLLFFKFYGIGLTRNNLRGYVNDNAFFENHRKSKIHLFVAHIRRLLGY